MFAAAGALRVKVLRLDLVPPQEMPPPPAFNQFGR